MDLTTISLLLWTGLVFWELGQIWFAQLVVYPLFAKVGAAEYVGYHSFYVKRIPAPVIVPGFTSFLLPIPLILLVPDVPVWMHAVNVAAGLVGLLVTVLLEIPRHTQLRTSGKDETTIAELIRFNWPRTLSITTQAAVTMGMLVHILAAH